MKPRLDKTSTNDMRWTRKALKYHFPRANHDLSLDASHNNVVDYSSGVDGDNKSDVHNDIREIIPDRTFMLKNELSYPKCRVTADI